MISSLVIRADASAQIGTGHIMRTLAIAQGVMKQGGNVTFVTSENTPSLEERLKSEGCTVHTHTFKRGSAEDAKETARVAKEIDASWIVADGYAFGKEFQNVIHSANLKLLLIDDFGNIDAYDADIILNQNISAKEEWYKDDASRLVDLAFSSSEESAEADDESRSTRDPLARRKRLLLGTDYALIRDEFLQHDPSKRTISERAKEILVTLGGSDRENMTLKILRALLPIKDIHVTAVLGGANPHREAIEKELQEAKNITLINNSSDMSSLMAKADLAISATGSTTWEILSMGLPLITGVIADNQEPSAKVLGEKGIAVNVGWFKDVSIPEFSSTIQRLIDSKNERDALSEAGRECVDGKGMSRVLDSILFN